MSYATANDVSALLARELTEEETALVERRLEQVERMILRRLPDLDAQVSSGAIAEEDVIDIEAEALLRLMRNPEGLFSETDGSYSYMFNREVSSGKLEILPAEWELLGVKTSKMFSITPNLVAPQRPPSFWVGG